ncbi:TAKT protein, partial [Pseudoatta argentina]
FKVVLSSYYIILNTFIKFKLFIASYIHVCGRNDPNYDQCIVNTINNINSKICTGMPELNVASAEPMNIDEIIIYNTDNLKLSVKESKIRGFCNFVINSLQVSSDKRHFDLDFVLKHLDMESVYDFDMRVLVPVANKGQVHVSADNLEAKIIIDFKEETKNGKTEIYASKVKTILNVKTFKYEFDDSEKNLVQLHEALTNIINENEKDIIIKVKPALEEAVSKLIITVVNNVVRSRFEQLFPNKA